MRIIKVKKNLGSKKVAVLKSIPDADTPDPTVVKWLKPGDKLKADSSPKHSYDDLIGDKKYMRVYYNGQEGWLVTSAIEE